MGENYFTALPVAFYGGVLLFSSIAYLILTMTLIVHHGQGSAIATAIGRDFKGKVSVAIYAVSILLAFANSWLAFSLYVLVAMIPDRRIEKAMR
jgi:uncharacterized membrane protein